MKNHTGIYLFVRPSAIFMAGAVTYGLVVYAAKQKAKISQLERRIKELENSSGESESE